MSKAKIIASNRRAYYDYEIVDTWEAGLVLKGLEVKGLREGNANIAEGWVRVKPRSAFLVGSFILPSQVPVWQRYNAKRDRKLLLHKAEIKRLMVATYKGLTVIPLKLYFNEAGYAKLEIATAKGKKKYDKRQTIKDRDAKRLGE